MWYCCRCDDYHAEQQQICHVTREHRDDVGTEVA